MSLIKILPEYLETFTLRLHPNRTFVSSSDEGVTSGDGGAITGTLGLVARPSPRIKSVVKISTASDTSGYGGTLFDQDNYFPSVILQQVNQDYIDNKRDTSWDGTGSYFVNLKTYMSGVNSTTGSHRNAKRFEITRFDAPFMQGMNNSVKNIIRNVLMPNYRSQYTNSDFTYTNYHTLNFFTSSAVPSGSALVYPNFSGTTPSFSNGMIGVSKLRPRPYTPLKGFTLQFYINPRYTTDDPVGTGGASSPTSGSIFRAGTIMHLSSTFAVSLVTGSSVDESGYPDRYRIMLQLSHSCGTKPSDVDLSISNSRRDVPNDLIFLSDDNALARNHWHHVAVRWGTSESNNGTGSFYVDGEERGHFAVNSSSIAATEPFGSRPSVNDPRIITGSDALVIGNFFEGSDYIGKLFNGAATGSEGCGRKVFEDDVDNPYRDSGNPTILTDSPQFSHPLNAEIHEVQIWKRSRTLEEIISSSHNGTGEIEVPWSDATKQFEADSCNDLAFYLPPFFVKESNPRKVTVTPYLFAEPEGAYASVERDSSEQFLANYQAVGTTASNSTAQTDAPFHISSSFAVAGHIMSLENFTRDFVTGYYPRLFHLTASVIDTEGFTKESGFEGKKTPDGKQWSANRYFYSNRFKKEIAKRNLTILPSDNGNFQPNFDLLTTGSGEGLIGEPDSIFKTSEGSLDKSIISLISLVRTGSESRWTHGFISDDYDESESTSFLRELCGVAPGGDTAFRALNCHPMHGNYVDYFYVYSKIQDPSSNQVSFFNIPNLFYGDRILPESFQVTDHTLTGSAGKIKITLRDNGKGGLYRADCTGSHPDWSNVGNIFYNEGVAIIKNPSLYLFGTSSFKTSFQGEQQTHVLTVNIPCDIGLFNSSSSPAFRRVSASFDANEYDPDFVYITGFNLHDDNLNVIGRANLAQPISKRESDEFLFKFRQDF